MPPPESSARTFFEYVKAHPDPFGYLSSIPDPDQPHHPFFEKEWLDFKGQPRDDKDAKAIWSKALSGFANVTDGIIIWGVDARTGPNGIDAASGLRLIPDPPLLESKLREWIRDATNAPVMDVDYAAFSGPAKEGFVVCLIPRSKHRPHRAEWSEKQQYYYRAGDDFLPAEPAMLRTLFYPELNPLLRAEVTLKYILEPTELADVYRKSNGDQGYNHLINKGQSLVQFEVKLYNEGDATAKNTYIVIQTDEDVRFHPGIDWSNRSNPLGKEAFAANRPLHPGEVSILCAGKLQREYNNRTLKPDGGLEIIPHFTSISLKLLMFAEGAQKQMSEVRFVPEDLDFQTGISTKRCIPIE